jgi:hypothetical protein
MRLGKWIHSLFVVSTEATAMAPEAFVETSQDLFAALPRWERHPFYRAEARNPREGLERIEQHIPR